MKPLPAGLPAGQITAVVPVLGRALAKAIRNDANWRRYMETIFAADAREACGQHGDIVGVYPLRDPLADLSGSILSEIARRPQALPLKAATAAPTLARELAQAITQNLHGTTANDRVTVFVSHTKHAASPRDTGPLLVESVRNVLQETHLDTFFDAHDIQVGKDWEQTLDVEAGRHALLMIRTDLYASREWTQREVLAAKVHDLPVVALYAVREQEERGSFLMDHVPVIPCPAEHPEEAIERALNRLVDEALKRALWLAQRVYLQPHGFDWLPVHAPEPITLTAWLRSYEPDGAHDHHAFIMHPDPPLGPREREVIVRLCELAGITDNVDILTPRAFAIRGGLLT
jgi:hypothetical protein